jgi:hypothetical protein
MKGVAQFHAICNRCKLDIQKILIQVFIHGRSPVNQTGYQQLYFILEKREFSANFQQPIQDIRRFEIGKNLCQ